MLAVGNRCAFSSMCEWRDDNPSVGLLCGLGWFPQIHVWICVYIILEGHPLHGFSRALTCGLHDLCLPLFRLLLLNSSRSLGLGPLLMPQPGNPTAVIRETFHVVSLARRPCLENQGLHTASFSGPVLGRS